MDVIAADAKEVEETVQGEEPQNFLALGDGQKPRDVKIVSTDGKVVVNLPAASPTALALQRYGARNILTGINFAVNTFLRPGARGHRFAQCFLQAVVDVDVSGQNQSPLKWTEKRLRRALTKILTEDDPNDGSPLLLGASPQQDESRQVAVYDGSQSVDQIFQATRGLVAQGKIEEAVELSLPVAEAIRDAVALASQVPQEQGETNDSYWSRISGAAGTALSYAGGAIQHGADKAYDAMDYVVEKASRVSQDTLPATLASGIATFIACSGSGGLACPPAMAALAASGSVTVGSGGIAFGAALGRRTAGMVSGRSPTDSSQGTRLLGGPSQSGTGDGPSTAASPEAGDTSLTITWGQLGTVDVDPSLLVDAGPVDDDAGSVATDAFFDAQGEHGFQNLGGGATKPRIVLCPATLPRGIEDSYLNPALSTAQRRLVENWQLLKVTRKDPGNPRYLGATCMTLDAASGATVEDIFEGNDKLLEFFRSFACVDFRGVCLPMDLEGSVAMTTRSPEDYAYVWFPTDKSVIPPEFRESAANVKVLDRLEVPGEVASLEKAREKARTDGVKGSISQPYLQSLFRDLVAAVVSAKQKLKGSGNLDSSIMKAAKEAVSSEGRGSKLVDKIVELSGKTVTRGTARRVTPRDADMDKLVASALRAKPSKEAFAKVIAPLYAALYMKQSLECIRMSDPDQFEMNVLAANYKDDEKYISGVQLKSKDAKCAYAPRLSPHLAWVHSDLVTKTALKKATRNPIYKWWRKFSYSVASHRRAARRASDRQLRRNFGFVTLG